MTRALVFGGGGVTGIAWETGVLVGLRDEGVDVTDADLIVGTSAGSAVGAQVASGDDLDGLYQRQLELSSSERAVAFDPMEFAKTFLAALEGADGAHDVRARIGALALAADTVSESERRAIIAARLSRTEWPERALVVTAVDEATGDLAAFDKDDGAPFVDAVAASCAVPGVWPPVTIGDRRYIDGGVRSVVNLDLAAGHDRVLVVAPSRLGIGRSVDDEIAALAVDARVLGVFADEDALAVMGPNPLDPAFRAPAARAGRRQGREAAADVRDVWAG
jgi:NTE family protein